METKVTYRVALSALFVAGFGLSACGGGGGGGGSIPTAAPSTAPGTSTPPPATSTPPPATVPPATPTPGGPATPTPGPPGPSNQTLRANDGLTNGEPNQYTPTFGNTPLGGQGSMVDGVPCLPMMPNNYHVHVFLGVYNNGTYVAQPYGTGMVDPQPPVNGFVSRAQCFYFTHTHDSSGIIHIEDSDNVPITQSLFNLKTYLDIWGMSAGPNHFGPFQGPVRVFTSGQMPGPLGGQLIKASTYTFYGQDPTNIPLYSHEVIWVEVGPNFPASLPNIQFFF